MPVYSYFCEHGHENERIVAISKRDEETECRECGSIAKRRPTVSQYQSLTAFAIAEAKRVRFSRDNWSGRVWRDYVCGACNHVGFDCVETKRGESETDPKPCEKCGKPATPKLCDFHIDRFSERFPYFDRGLGMWLQSKKHRRNVCRARGLTPVEGDWSVESVYRDRIIDDEKDKQAYDDYVNRLEHDPAFGDYRRAKDQGRI